MENQDNLYRQFKDAAGKAENRSFDKMDAIWSRVEEKLDRAKKRRSFPMWQYASVAAMLLTCLLVGTYMLNNDSERIIAPEVLRENQLSTMIDTQKVSDEFESAKSIKHEVLVNAEETSPVYGIKSNSPAPVQDSIRFSKKGKKAIVNKSKAKISVASSPTLKSGKKVNLNRRSDPRYVNTEKTATTSHLPVNTPGSIVTLMPQVINYTIDTINFTPNIVSFDTENTAVPAEATAFSSKGIISKTDPDYIYSLQGKIAGLTITPDVHKGVIIGNNLAASLHAVFVIDGTVTSRDVFRQIDRKNIKSIQVIKGDEAVKSYGETAGNGALVVTTQNLSSKQKRHLKKLMKQQAGKGEVAPLEFKPLVLPDTINRSQKKD